MDEDKDLVVSVTMTVSQAQALIAASDLAYRVAAGDWREVSAFAALTNRDADTAGAHYGPISQILSALSVMTFTGKTHENMHYGILSDRLHPQIVQADVVAKSLRRAIAYHRNPEGGWSVCFDPVMNWQRNSEPLPVVKIESTPK
jgi:hypothetical protein